MHSPRILPTAASLPSAVTRVRRNLSARYATAPVYVCRRLDLCVRIAVTGSGSGHCVHGVCTVVIGLRSRGSRIKRNPIYYRRFDGGRTRARTLDPLIKSQIQKSSRVAGRLAAEGSVRRDPMTLCAACRNLPIGLDHGSYLVAKGSRRLARLGVTY